MLAPSTLSTLRNGLSPTVLLVCLLPISGATHGKGHQPVKITWVVTNMATGDQVSTTTLTGSINDGWPNISVDFCKLADGFITSQGWDPCEDWTVRKGTFHLDSYICPGFNRTSGQVEQCGGVEDNYCKNWGCETTRHNYWLRGSKGFITLKKGKEVRIWGPKPGDPTCDRYTCVPYVLGFTEKGKQYAGWDTGTNWGLRLYKTGHDFGVLFSVLRKIEVKTIQLGPTVPRPTIQPRLVSPSLTTETATPRSDTQNKKSRPKPQKDMTTPEDSPWVMAVQTAFTVLNSTKPDLTDPCLLCLTPGPPYFEAAGVTGNYNTTNNFSPGQCTWTPQFSRNRNQVKRGGLTLPLFGNATCVFGGSPKNKHIGINNCSQIRTGTWAFPAQEGVSWLCKKAGWVPCLSISTLTQTNDTCAMVIVLPRVLYWGPDELLARVHTREKREVITAATLATVMGLGLMGLGIVGTATGPAAIAITDQKFKELHHMLYTNLDKMEVVVQHLKESLDSLAEVVIQNRRGLDLITLEQGGICKALEECCFYADHSGVITKNLNEIRKGLEYNRPNTQSWYEGWFNTSPWLTTLLSALAGPLIILMILVALGPCVLNRLVKFIRQQTEEVQLMALQTRYQPIPTNAQRRR